MSCGDAWNTYSSQLGPDDRDELLMSQTVILFDATWEAASRLEESEPRPAIDD
jgi:hypothetical protein